MEMRIPIGPRRNPTMRNPQPLRPLFEAMMALTTPQSNHKIIKGMIASVKMNDAL
jgi:hypothetical protein